MALLQPKVPFWVFPCACWSPYFCSVWWLWMGTKQRTIFQKQIVATKTRTFFTFRTQIVFAYFSKKWQFNKKRPFFFTTTPKTLFSGLFWNCPFPFFHIFLFTFFPTLKRQKQKVRVFFENPFFDTLTNCPKNICAPLHTIWDLKHTQKTL